MKSARTIAYMKFRTEIRQSDGNATGIEIPDEVLTAIGAQKPAVTITVNGYPYRSTVATVNGRSMVASARRTARRPAWPAATRWRSTSSSTLRRASSRCRPTCRLRSMRTHWREQRSTDYRTAIRATTSARSWTQRRPRRASAASPSRSACCAKASRADMTKVNRTIRLGGREVTRMGMGTNRLTPTPDNIEHVRQAVAAGIGMIDTAHLYTTARVSSPSAKRSRRSMPLLCPSWRPRAATAAATAGRRSCAARSSRACAVTHQADRPVLPAPCRSRNAARRRAWRSSPSTARAASSATSACRRSASSRSSARARLCPSRPSRTSYNLDDRAWDDVVDYCTSEGIVFVPFYPLQPRQHRRAARHGPPLRRHASQITLAWLLHRSPNILPIPGTLAIDHRTRERCRARHRAERRGHHALAQPGRERKRKTAGRPPERLISNSRRCGSGEGASLGRVELLPG